MNENNALYKGNEEPAYPEGVADESGQIESAEKPFANQVEEWGDKAHG